MELQDRYIRFDWAVKRLLRHKANFGVLEGFLTVLIGDDIHIVEILESEGNQQTEEDKFNRVDIKALNSKNEIVIIEIQNTRELYYLERILYGVAKAITEHISLGETYYKVKKIYSISILYFDIGYGTDYLYHGQNIFKGVHTGDFLQVSTREKDAIVPRMPSEIYPEYFLIRVNEFNKVAMTPLEEWIEYLKTGIIRPDTTAPGLGEAREKLKYYSMTPQERHAYDEHLSALMIDGILIYSTCTYSLDENEKQVEYMINELGMKLLPINKKEGMSDGFIEGTIRMYPHINRGEGQFIAMLQKTTETAISKEKILKPNLKKEQLQLVQKFYQENLNIPVPPYLYQSNNHVYAILNHFPELPIKVLRNGLYLGECKKGRFEPSLSLALTLNKDDVKRSYNFKCDSQEVKDYLSGLTLKENNQKGYGVIFVDGYPLSFYKESNNQVKNLYPKGLRR